MTQTLDRGARSRALFSATATPPTTVRDLVLVPRDETRWREASGHQALATVDGVRCTAAPARIEPPAVPDYLREVYSWAYLNPRAIVVFDHTPVVNAILWGNFHRLKREALNEIAPGQRVLQAACVYGDLSPTLARHIGEAGRLDVIDVAPIQVRNCRRKLRGFRHASVRLADAVRPGGDLYDVVCCFFLLHEVPSTYKRKVVNALLAHVAPGGKAVFVDYHRPHWAHPLRAITSFVFATLEPFARELWDHEIASYAEAPEKFAWRTQTYFGSLFQKTVAERR
jgi:ubiquinone/menaquinone biosynthesis C-methylase UbiE